MVYKHTGLLGKKVNIVLDMQPHFEKKITFLGKKSIKCPVLYAQFEEKLNFLEFLLYKHTGLLGKKVKIVLDMQAHLRKKSPFRGEKSKKCPVLYAQFEEKLTSLEFLL